MCLPRQSVLWSFDLLYSGMGSVKVGAYGRIHGGSFVVGTGSDPLFDGTTLAQSNVVVVTFNYRRTFPFLVNLTS
jgi:hypothetical protein